MKGGICQTPPFRLSQYDEETDERCGNSYRRSAHRFSHYWRTFAEGMGISPLTPQRTVVIELFELLMMYQTPVDGRHIAMSVLPSPS